MGHEPVILPIPSKASKGGECFPLKLIWKQREALIASTHQALSWRLCFEPG